MHSFRLPLALSNQSSASPEECGARVPSVRGRRAKPVQILLNITRLAIALLLFLLLPSVAQAEKRIALTPQSLRSWRYADEIIE
jgi:hypothetical protein